MKFITERTQIAQFFNSKPVIKIDMEKPVEGYETIFKGEEVKVMTPSTCHPDLFCVGTMTYSAENKKFYVSSAGSMLKGSFGYDDVMELLTWNHAPVVSKDMEVGILEDFPSKKECRIRVMKVKWVNSQSFEVCTFEDVE